MSTRTLAITGASRGLGVAVAEVAAAEGFYVALGARDADAVERLAADLADEHGVGGLGMRCDVTDVASIASFRDAIIERFGRLDVVVANAGIGSFGPMVGFDSDAFDAMFAVNVRGVWATLSAVADDLEAAPTRGTAILVSSDVSDRVFPGGGPYVATKHAVRALARTFQQEHPQLRVCELRPGSTRSSFAGQDPTTPSGEGVLSSTDVARTLRVVLTAPDDVRIEELVVRSAGQAPDY
jgi:3-oxoacyl-[acyl-carrier protein] reductase